MKRSTNITLVLLTAVAAAACDEQNEIKHCVNEDGVVQEEEKCKDAPVTVPTGSDGGVAHGSGGGGGHFFWYYGGGGSRTPVAPGGRVSGGSYSPSSGKTYAPSSGFSGGGSKGGSVGGSHGGGNSPSVGRGGFGGTGGGHAGGGGG